ncbi:hypothetical protein [Muricoccus aerilatus]|uniref:hypothetical protein n=1 Tax=Muricoccus aerilatus TaxID=452982 RepID=UPI000A5871E9|nr:hypothetical protein [Roseomonas aerilata]
MDPVRCADRGLAVSSLRVHLAAIQAAHRLAVVALDLRHPRLVMVLEGIARDKGTRPRGKAAAAGPDVLWLMLATRPSPATLLGARPGAAAARLWCRPPPQRARGTLLRRCLSTPIGSSSEVPR